jgi:predicted transglutaminase-like cysteine proteinase
MHQLIQGPIALLTAAFLVVYPLTECAWAEAGQLQASGLQSEPGAFDMVDLRLDGSIVQSMAGDLPVVRAGHPGILADPVADVITSRHSRASGHPATRHSFSPAIRSNSSLDRDKPIQISFSTPALAPMAFLRFCHRYPRDCESNNVDIQPQSVELTTARRAELSSVNRKVNLAIKPEQNTAGVTAERWLIYPRWGDCNDFAVTKRHELLERGWPSHSLLLAEVIVPSGEHHLVLVVRGRKDDLVLDNLNPHLQPVSDVDYRWVRAQQTTNPRFWSTVSVVPLPAQLAMTSH